MQKVILFDGVCNLCSSSVQFIIKRDPTGTFQFASLQSEVAQQLLQERHISTHLDTIILIEGERVYTKSTAVLKIAGQLQGAYKLFAIFRIVPRPIRDVVYQFIAKKRYRWFGKQEQCMVPSPDIRQRFLDN
ncbi:thiol-disulfide oxidoreductase DCC family protein [Gracilibacillus sp. S3-1-1]|uniref:Thiol-disulfide oxidoreductase DCC family protein n=1 Tax=Gracilibacillus pellucidus TaxID=3095368 RepID=A0ACC6M4G7_9BACI|nr:thiol-disulfide oxidoreductase DCC family protein [Gracilibacillus sp. S3-1-1]MDX8045806.1 thiol-disulfide oxidoreductase DCC family protein [Gracilibacillus sp. S3-1-1]